MNDAPYEPVSLATYRPSFEAARPMWAMSGALELAAETRFGWLLGKNNRWKFARAFSRSVADGASEDDTRRAFFAECRNEGVPWSLIFLVAEMVFRALWAWWSHRNDP